MGFDFIEMEGDYFILKENKTEKTLAQFPSSPAVTYVEDGEDMGAVQETPVLTTFPLGLLVHLEPLGSDGILLNLTFQYLSTQVAFMKYLLNERS